MTTTRSLSTGVLFRYSPIWLFAAGFISVLVFQQGALALAHAMGVTPAKPFPDAARAPFGVPAIWSLAFWGGVWGLVFGYVEKWFPQDTMYWVAAIVFGAIAPTLVLWFIVFPLKGQPVAAGWAPSSLLLHPYLHGAWGLGTAVMLRARP